MLAKTITVDGKFMHVSSYTCNKVFSSLNGWPYKIRKDKKILSLALYMGSHKYQQLKERAMPLTLQAPEKNCTFV